MKNWMITSLLLLMPLLLAPTAMAAEDEREFSATIPAADIETLQLEANVGSVRVTGHDGDQIEISVRLELGDDWFGSSERAQERLASAELQKDVSGSRLRLGLDYDRNRDGDDDLEEHWLIEMPASLAAELTLNVGEMEVRGLAGGVNAEVNVGELDINVEAGDVDAEVNVGEISVVSRTGGPGEIDMDVNVGDARLLIDGKRIEGKDGAWLGGSIRHDAGGDDDISVEINVGDSHVEIIE